MSAFGCHEEVIREIEALRAANKDLKEWFDASELDRKELLQFVKDFYWCDNHDCMCELFKRAEKIVEKQE